MSSQSLVVAIEAELDNFAVLGTGLTLTQGDTIKKITIHNSPAMSLDGVQVNFNFDFLITSDVAGFKFSDVVPEERLLVLKRYSKEVQAARLLNGLASYESDGNGTSSFLPVPTWSVGWGGRNYPTLAGKVVIKPADGARGIGQFVLDTEFVNIDYFTKELKQLVDGEHNQANLDAFIKRFGDKVTYHPGGEQRPFEGLDCLKHQGVVVQTVITGIREEWRIITNHESYPVYCQKRKVRDPESTFPQATGGGGTIDRDMIYEYADLPSSVIQPLFEHLCRHVIGPMNSIDLFITEDRKWGIFEYCNQFGISGVPSATATVIHTECIGDLCSRLD